MLTRLFAKFAKDEDVVYVKLFDPNADLSRVEK